MLSCDLIPRNAATGRRMEQERKHLTLPARHPTDPSIEGGRTSERAAHFPLFF